MLCFHGAIHKERLCSIVSWCISRWHLATHVRESAGHAPAVARALRPRSHSSSDIRLVSRLPTPRRVTTRCAIFRDRGLHYVTPLPVTPHRVIRKTRSECSPANTGRSNRCRVAIARSRQRRSRTWSSGCAPWGGEGHRGIARASRSSTLRVEIELRSA